MLMRSVNEIFHGLRPGLILGSQNMRWMLAIMAVGVLVWVFNRQTVPISRVAGERPSLIRKNTLPPRSKSGFPEQSLKTLDTSTNSQGANHTNSGKAGPPLEKPENSSLDIFDQRLLKKSALRNATDPWAENTFGPLFVSDQFATILRPLETPGRSFQLNLKLWRKRDVANVVPQSIIYPSTTSEQLIEYEDFVSQFAEHEPYIGMLAFPYDAFWQRLFPNLDCTEIGMLYDEIKIEGPIRNLNGRVFCRKDLRRLSSVATFTAQSQHGSQP